jgi:formamidopyrimidine-DNA glycosylase
VPELPEVESARTIVERSLGRRIVAVDDRDEFVCRPHRPGEIAAVLLGSTLDAVHRRGKSMWCDTSAGPILGIHLGMAGKIVVSTPDGEEVDGGDYWSFKRAPGDHRFTRFALAFADGSELRLVDPRRLGRVRLDPPVEALGPDAAAVGRAELADRLGHGTGPIKARLMDQHVVAGIGNLLADEVLWRGGILPARPVQHVGADDRAVLHRHLRKAIKDAIRKGGVHTLTLIPHRRAGGRCPQDGAELRRGTVGGRTTWWCPEHQR